MGECCTEPGKKPPESVEDEEKATLKLLPVLRRIFQHLGIENQRVLDVGCGSGLVLSLLGKRNSVCGIDLSKEAIKIARQRGLSVKQGSVEEPLPFKTDFFDFVVCKDVFEHLQFPEKTLKEISRVLKKNGMLFAHVPNEFNLFSRARIMLGKGIVEKRWFRNAEEWNYPHLRFFTKKGFKSFLEGCSFEIAKNYSSEWCYLGLKPLSRFFPTLFSPGITFLAKNKKKR